MAKDITIVGYVDVCGVILVRSVEGERYVLEYHGLDGAIPLTRRIMAHALRQLADRFDAQADEVGD